MATRGAVGTTAKVAGSALLACFVVSVAAYLSGNDPTLLFRDLAMSTGADPFMGAMSALGVMLWTTAAGISLFAAAVLRARGQRVPMRFSLFFGLLSAMLAIDDQFMIHEELVERVWAAGQPLYVLVYGGALVSFLVTQRSLLAERSLPLLLAALLFLGGSVVLDQVSDLLGVKSGVMALLEDIAKFTGIALWCSYGVERAFRFVTTPGSAGPDGGKEGQEAVADSAVNS